MNARDPIPLAAVLLARVPLHALRLAAQLFGVPPCECCDYIKAYCRCHEDGKGTQ